MKKEKKKEGKPVKKLILGILLGLIAIVALFYGYLFVTAWM